MDRAITTNSSRDVVNTLIAALDKRQRILSFLAASVLFYFCQKYINAQIFLGDARDYWFLSSFIWDMSYPKTIRGYFFPFILSPIKLISDTLPALGYFPIRIFQSVAYGLTFAIVFPSVFLKIFGGTCSFARRLVIPILIAIFFPGLVAYPLSDLPAFALLLASIYIAFSASDARTKSAMCALMLLSGFLAYGAYNSRQIYIFPVTVLIALIPGLIYKNSEWKIKALALAMFIAGLAATSAPQSLINKKHFDSSTPLVISNLRDTSLFASQLKWGITIQRYETKLSEDRKDALAVFYFDPAGDTLFKKNNVKEITATVPWYLGLVMSEPVAFAKIYLKHFVNGIDVRDEETYTTTPSKDKNIRSAFSIAISYLGIILLAFIIFRKNPEEDKTPTSKALWAFLFLIPVFAILPGAIETRFFFPLHALLFAAIAFGAGLNRPKNLKTSTIAMVTFIYIAMVSVSILTTRASISSPLGSIPDEYRAVQKNK